MRNRSNITKHPNLVQNLKLLLSWEKIKESSTPFLRSYIKRYLYFIHTPHVISKTYGAFKTEEYIQTRAGSWVKDSGSCFDGTILSFELCASLLLLTFPLTLGFFSCWILNLGIGPLSPFISKPLTYLQKLHFHFQHSFISMLDSFAGTSCVLGSLCQDFSRCPYSCLGVSSWNWPAHCCWAIRHILESSVTFISFWASRFSLGSQVSTLPPTPVSLFGLSTHILCSSQLGLCEKYVTLWFSTCVHQCMSFFLCRMSNLSPIK